MFRSLGNINIYIDIKVYIKYIWIFIYMFIDVYMKVNDEIWKWMGRLGSEYRLREVWRLDLIFRD